MKHIQKLRWLDALSSHVSVSRKKNGEEAEMIRFLSWPYTSLEKAERRRRVLCGFRIFFCVYLMCSRLSPHASILRLFRHKENRETSKLYLYHRHHHHHRVVLVARISLTLSRHFSLSFIASGRSSGLHPVSSHSCWMYVRAGRPAFARLYVGVHKSTSLMSSSLLLQQCPACLVRLIWIVFVIGGRWPYSLCLVGCCRQDLFKIARSILV